jgi:multidrug efflux system outer membrane protein
LSGQLGQGFSALFLTSITVLNAFREVSDTLIEIQTYKDQITAVKRKYSAAKNAEYLGKMRYDKGVSSYLEVLETERTLFDVELELSATTQEYYNSYVRFYKALGGGWISKQEEQEVIENEAQQEGSEDSE